MSTVSRKADPGDIAEYLARKFSDEYQTQAVVVSGDEAFAQIRKVGRLRALLGLRQNVTIRVHVSDGGTLVEVGKAAWADKAVALSVGWVFSLGLPFLTAPWGIYSQHQAVKRAWALVEYRMADQPALQAIALDLGNTFGEPLSEFSEFFGAPLCWQATAVVGGQVWRDSGSGPCPPVVRVPNGAADVLVTDDGMPVSPRILEG